MPPRDSKSRAAVIVGTDSIECLDVEEYLAAHGWAEPIRVTSIREAQSVLADEVQPVELVVLLTPPSDPDIPSFVRSCGAQGVCVIMVDGAADTMVAGQAITLARPFVDDDFDRALAALGFAGA